MVGSWGSTVVVEDSVAASGLISADVSTVEVVSVAAVVDSSENSGFSEGVPSVVASAAAGVVASVGDASVTTAASVVVEESVEASVDV